MKSCRTCLHVIFLPIFAATNLCAQVNGVYREVYLGIAGSAVADLTNAPAFPNSPSSTKPDAR